MDYKILASRFQPFHNGHLAILKQALLDLDDNCVFVIGIVVPSYSEPIDATFGNVASEHLQPDRNPWPADIPLRAVQTLIDELFAEKKKQVAITLLPSPDGSYKQLLRWFTGTRCWIIPNANEEFDDAKASFFESQGDSVIRYCDSTGINGWKLRNAYYNRNYNAFAQEMPACIVPIYWHHRSEYAF